MPKMCDSGTDKIQNTYFIFKTGGKYNIVVNKEKQGYHCFTFINNGTYLDGNTGTNKKDSWQRIPIGILDIG